MLRSGELAERYRSLVITQSHPAGRLVVLNYTRECAYSRTWDDVTIHCRGLVVDTQSWEVAAWPFPKFFNLHERPETQPEALPREPFTAFEKLDGSLGVLVRTSEGMVVATRARSRRNSRARLPRSTS
jgi:RNA ligase